MGDDLAERIAARRRADGPYASVEDLVRRAEVPLPAVARASSAASPAPVRPTRSSMEA
ncbi:MAG: hypothetical protein M3N37_07100 [Actinomycetota bacterium]|nr:hypothetical protein [Actinomycetota bacterium]